MKMNAKYMNEDVWKFFRKFAGWHLPTSSKIYFAADKIQRFWVNKLFRMATSRSCIKSLKSICEIIFFAVSTGWNSAYNLHMKLVSERFFIEEVLRKTSPNSQINTRSSHPLVFCQDMLLKIMQNSQKTIFVEVSSLIKLQAANPKLSEAASGDDL